MGFSLKGFGQAKKTDDTNSMTKGAAVKMNSAPLMQYTSPVKQKIVRGGKVVSGRDPGDLGAGSEYAGETTTTGRVIPEGGFRRGEETIIDVGSRKRTTKSNKGVRDTRDVSYIKEGGMSTFITPEGRYHADDVSTQEYRKGYGRIHKGKQEVTTHYYNPKSKEANEKGYAPKYSKVKDKKVVGSRGYTDDGYVIEGTANRIKTKKGASTKPKAKVLTRKKKK